MSTYSYNPSTTVFLQVQHSYTHPDFFQVTAAARKWDRGTINRMTIDERLLEPGWAGELAEDQLANIQGELLADKKLSYLWGFAPAQQTRPLEAIRRVAMDGDLDRRSQA